MTAVKHLKGFTEEKLMAFVEGEGGPDGLVPGSLQQFSLSEAVFARLCGRLDNLAFVQGCGAAEYRANKSWHLWSWASPLDGIEISPVSAARRSTSWSWKRTLACCWKIGV
jgi:hypothetical protein